MTNIHPLRRAGARPRCPSTIIALQNPHTAPKDMSFRAERSREIYALPGDFMQNQCVDPSTALGMTQFLDSASSSPRPSPLGRVAERKRGRERLGTFRLPARIFYRISPSSVKNQRFLPHSPEGKAFSGTICSFCRAGARPRRSSGTITLPPHPAAPKALSFRAKRSGVEKSTHFRDISCKPGAKIPRLRSG